MAVPITITFIDMEPSPALREDIERHAEKLEQFAPRLLSCEVTVRRSEARRRQGNRYLVHVLAKLPGTFLEAGKSPDPDQSHEDAHVAARDSFDAMRRQLEDYVRIQRGEVKAHPPDQTKSMRR